jgi:hypothetical protein
MVSRSFFVIFSLIFSLKTLAWETDQYTNRAASLGDSTAYMNAKVNTEILSVIESWKLEDNYNENLFVRQVYKRLSGNHLFTKYEAWLLNSPEIDKLALKTNIYHGADFIGGRFNIFFSGSPTILAGDVRFGCDKPSHFVSEGYTYFWLYHSEGLDFKKILSLGMISERSILGTTVSGVYSSGDLIANFEGFRFYESLFNPQILTNKGALIAWTPQGPRLRHPFDFRDHITEAWDEALYPPALLPHLQKTVLMNLKNLCGEYLRQPDLYRPKFESMIFKRYGELGLKIHPENRLENVCR